ncbi:hypothetical protein C8R47DRAFT_146253 [Mycena vitilis]|nr:hypothetical protein C8R47DRAFT_146253 [Mycena vitilis]
MSNSKLNAPHFYGPAPPAVDAIRNAGLAAAALQSDTPVHNRVASRRPFSSVNDQFLEPAFVLAANELSHKVVSTSAEHFLSHYLPPIPDATLPNIDFPALAKISRSDVEKDMYGPLIGILNAFVKEKWAFVDTSNSPDPKSAFLLDHIIKPDITLYSDKKPSSSSLCRAIDMEFFVELKTDPLDDPFSDVGDFEKGTITARDSRGQVLTYLNAMQASQFRTHSFGAIIIGKKCRLLRLTRSSLEATTAFDYTKTRYLPEFLWRLSHGSEAARGIDTSFELMHQDLAMNYRSILGIGAIGAPFWKVAVGDRSFFVAAPFTSSHHLPVGRGTRCFVAVESATGQKCLLKDTWRVDGYNKEDEVYARLHKHGVRNIAKILAAQDVLDHTCGKFPDSWVVPLKSTIREHTHFRIVLDVVGKPITNFPSTHALVRYMLDTVRAHHDAFTEAKVEHRDVSPNNIIIIDKGDESVAYLIDWESAKYEEEKYPRAFERTGPRQFMAARLCVANPPTRNLADEMESFVHVLAWLAIGYAPSYMTPEQRALALNAYDDLRGAQRINMLMSGEGAIVRLQLECPQFEELLSQIFEVFKYRYKQLPRLNAEGRQESFLTKQALSEDHLWLEGKLQESLDDEEWKMCIDPGTEQEVEELQRASTRKRKSELTEYQQVFRDKKKWRGERGPNNDEETDEENDEEEDGDDAKPQLLNFEADLFGTSEAP